MRDEVLNSVNERILSQLDQGIVPWRRPWKLSTPKNAITGREYGGINVWLLPDSYPTNQWLTFQQCSKAGGSVNPGERGSKIYFYTFGYTRKNPNGEDEKIAYDFPILKEYTVFNVDQCHMPKGSFILDIPEKIIDKNKKAEQIIFGYKDRPKVIHATNEAFYSPTEDYIQVPHPEYFDTMEGYYKTLFHEYVHSTNHPTRLNRERGTRFGDPKYGKEELVAEFGASYLAGLCQMDPTVMNDIAYIQNWKNAICASKILIISAAGAAQKAVRYILGENDETN